MSERTFQIYSRKKKEFCLGARKVAVRDWRKKSKHKCKRDVQKSLHACTLSCVDCQLKVTVFCLLMRKLSLIDHGVCLFNVLMKLTC